MPSLVKGDLAELGLVWQGLDWFESSYLGLVWQSFIREGLAELGLIWKFLLRFGLTEFHKGGFGRAWIDLEVPT